MNKEVVYKILTLQPKIQKIIILTLGAKFFNVQIQCKESQKGRFLQIKEHAICSTHPLGVIALMKATTNVTHAQFFTFRNNNLIWC